VPYVTWCPGDGWRLREGEGAAARLVVSLASVERLRLERQAAGKDSKIETRSGGALALVVGETKGEVWQSTSRPNP
jgi:hypothetical protein